MYFKTVKYYDLNYYCKQEPCMEIVHVFAFFLDSFDIERCLCNFFSDGKENNFWDQITLLVTAYC